METKPEDVKEKVRNHRWQIDDDKMKILRIEQDIQRNEGIIEGMMFVADGFKPGCRTCDDIWVMLLNGLEKKFEDESEYSGATIKNLIQGVLVRMNRGHEVE